MVGSETLYYQWISRIKKDVLERPSLIIVATYLNNLNKTNQRVNIIEIT